MRLTKMFIITRVKYQLYAIAAATIALASGCKATPLPESGTSAERVYASRCGACHRAYNPHSMTSAMWQAQLAVMEQKIAQAGQPPLNAGQREQILSYLERNAGAQ
jgi:cytochrome c5